MPSKPSFRLEQQRLRAREDDWNLVTVSGEGLSRTRGRGSGRPNIESARQRKEMFITEVGPEDVSIVEESLSTVSLPANDTSSSEVSSPNKKAKPSNSRVILEVDHIQEVFDKLGCPKRGGPIKPLLKTVCISSRIGFECLNERCDVSHEGVKPSATTMHAELDDNFERSTDYAINVLYVLGFVSVGDGCTEAARLLGVLGLPNDTTMESRSFTIIEERLVPVIGELLRDIIQANLVEEVKATMLNADDFKVWLDALNDKSIRIKDDNKPRVQASYDMAWQQKGSGHVYNSLSGHGTFIGKHSRKVIALVMKCKTCSTCCAWKKKHGDLDPPPHQCWKNHEGSSGSMECAGCLELVVKLYDESNVIVDMLCCDDDSSIRADCQWSNENYLINNNTDVLPLVPKKVGVNKGKLQPRPDKGKLPGHIPEPIFVADPNHRRKVLSGELIAMDKASADKRFTMTRMDSTRISKNFAYMARTLKDRPQEEFLDAAHSVLDHHFDIHDNCGDWCKRKSSISTRPRGKRLRSTTGAHNEMQSSTQFYKRRLQGSLLWTSYWRWLTEWTPT
jgi:hypothetical protein